MNGTVILAAVMSFLITALSGRFLIPYLKKLKYGQTILEIGPKWHKSKQGTPTMGGLMFILGITAATTAGFVTWLLLRRQTQQVRQLEQLRLIAGLVMALLYGALGFLDDYIKVVKKRNLGLTARQKMLFQILIAAAYLAVCYLGGDRNTAVWIPFFSYWELGIFYYPVALFIIIGFVNAVNLTDGIDGLAAGVTFVASLGMMAVSALLSLYAMNIMAAALAGGCLGFLLYNFHPAKVFMGDTGSMFLGGLIVALCFGVQKPLLLVLCGVIYLIEAGSVMLQVSYFKLTHGKRIFKMSPIHHHFEMSGWSEEKIVGVFSLITMVGALLSVAAVLLEIH